MLEIEDNSFLINLNLAININYREVLGALSKTSILGAVIVCSYEFSLCIVLDIAKV